MNPRDCKYSRAYTWVRVEGGEGTIGITDYAQQQLGSILFIEVAKVGDSLAQDRSLGSIESDKAVSDVISPVSGEVVAVNEDAINAPETINQDPYGAGWLLKVRLKDKKELEALFSAEEFEKHLASTQ